MVLYLNAAFPSRMYRCYTMECLMAAAFGRYVNIQNGEGNELTDAASDVFLFMRETWKQCT